MPCFYLCFVACHLNFFSPSSWSLPPLPYPLSLSLCLTPPVSLFLLADTDCIHLQSLNITFLPCLWPWAPWISCWPNGFLLHVCTHTLITRIMLADCMSADNPPTHIRTSAHMHSCMLANIGTHTHRDSRRVIGRAGVTGLSSPTHSRSAGDCVTHGPFATWIMKCNKDRVKQGYMHTSTLKFAHTLIRMQTHTWTCAHFFFSLHLTRYCIIAESV